MAAYIRYTVSLFHIVFYKLDTKLCCLVGACAENGKAMIPYELEENRGLKEFLEEYKKDNNGQMALFIGPEGGFSAEEIEKALSLGILPVTLGKRILRTETAGLTAIANTLFYLDM